jgi:hypothetical protein
MRLERRPSNTGPATAHADQHGDQHCNRCCGYAATNTQTQTVTGAVTSLTTGSLGDVNNNITGGINTISITTGFNNVTQNSVNVGAVGSFNGSGGLGE